MRFFALNSPYIGGIKTAITLGLSKAAAMASYWLIKKTIATLGLIAVLGLSVSAALASTEPASDWSDMGHAKVRLISATEALGPDGTARLGLQFQMQDGWKVYWRSPGDAGYPPNLDWSGSANLQDTTFQWPKPERFSVLGLTTLGYKKEVVFPIDAKIERADRGLLAVAEVDYLTCNDVCIPVQTTLTLALQQGEPTPTRFAHDIDQFRAQVPRPAESLGLTVGETAFFKVDDNSGILRVQGASSLPLDDPDLFVEGPKALEFAPTQVALADDGLSAVFDVPVYGLKFYEGELTAETLRLTMVDTNRAGDVMAAVTPGQGITPALPERSDHGAVEASDTVSSDVAPLVLMLGFALLGGLILNAMPCVLPVLSIKLLSLVKHGGGETQAVRFGFLASAAGIVTSFMILALALVALKSAGLAIGWGIQFQQPLFLGFMALVVTGFAMNLFGAFEVRLPSRLANIGGGNQQGLAGHFMTGMLATLLATPCSAPFLGTAVAFALPRGTGEILAIFFALGIGLAIPYLAVAAFPKCATMMPKPGPWMAKLKNVMGLALLATALWLLWVLSGIVAPAILTAMIGLLALFALSLVFVGKDGVSGTLTKGTAAIAVTGLLIAANLHDDETASRAQVAELSAEVINWVPFDEGAIPTLVRDGKVVFVDVTADWCITCQVNKTFVLSTEGISAHLNSDNVVAMQADWTRPDPKIAAYLASFDRYGIPFNVIYGPGSPAGQPLGELLVSGEVMKGLQAAGLNATAVANQ